MTKIELSEMLHSVKIPINEGITCEENINDYPRILYWQYIWEDIVASGEEYHVKATYQISFYSRVPSHEKLIELRETMRKEGLHPVIYHEYVEKDKVWHSYFALEVIE